MSGDDDDFKILMGRIGKGSFINEVLRAAMR
jgi:hypothetical protein